MCVYLFTYFRSTMAVITQMFQAGTGTSPWVAAAVATLGQLCLIASGPALHALCKEQIRNGWATSLK